MHFGDSSNISRVDFDLTAAHSLLQSLCRFQDKAKILWPLDAGVISEAMDHCKIIMKRHLLARKHILNISPNPSDPLCFDVAIKDSYLTYRGSIPKKATEMSSFSNSLTQMPKNIQIKTSWS